VFCQRACALQISNSGSNPVPKNPYVEVKPMVTSGVSGNRFVTKTCKHVPALQSRFVIPSTTAFSHLLISFATGENFHFSCHLQSWQKPSLPDKLSLLVSHDLVVFLHAVTLFLFVFKLHVAEGARNSVADTILRDPPLVKQEFIGVTCQLQNLAIPVLLLSWLQKHVDCCPSPSASVLFIRSISNLCLSFVNFVLGSGHKSMLLQSQIFHFNNLRCDLTQGHHSVEVVSKKLLLFISDGFSQEISEKFSNQVQLFLCGDFGPPPNKALT
jgi:hypothetical protein